MSERIHKKLKNEKARIIEWMNRAGNTGSGLDAAAAAAGVQLTKTLRLNSSRKKCNKNSTQLNNAQNVTTSCLTCESFLYLV